MSLPEVLGIAYASVTVLGVGFQVALALGAPWGRYAMLDALPDTGWTRTANVKVYGEPFEFTVHYYGDKLARHEAVHLPQIAGIVSSLKR